MADRIRTPVTGVVNCNAAGWATPALGSCGLLHVFNLAIDGTIASTVPVPSWRQCSHSLRFFYSTAITFVHCSDVHTLQDWYPWKCFGRIGKCRIRRIEATKTPNWRASCPSPADSFPSNCSPMLLHLVDLLLPLAPSWIANLEQVELQTFSVDLTRLHKLINRRWQSRHKRTRREQK